MGIPMSKIRWSWDHLIFNMGIQYRKYHCGDKTVIRSSYLHNGFLILVRYHLYIEMAPGSWSLYSTSKMITFPYQCIVNIIRYLYIFRWWCIKNKDWSSPKIKNGKNCYHQTSNIRCTKSKYLDVFHLILQLSLPNPWKSDVKSRMKM